MKPTTLLLPAILLLASACAAAPQASQTPWTPLPASAWHWNGHPKTDGLPKLWTVEADGSLHHAPGKGNWTGGDLISDDGSWHDFELELEWKVGHGANSGVFYRGKDGQKQPSTKSFEHQILDDAGFNGGREPAVCRTGALYAIVAANEHKELKPVGEWNTTRIVADGRHLEHWLNGKRILRVDLDSPEFKDTFAKSKWKGDPEKGAAPNGFIGLQDHGGEVWYRNIRAKKLPAK